MNGVISVVVPVFNHSHTLCACVASILRQQINLPNNPLEIIIVNDGSTDNFSQVSKEILKNDLAKSKVVKIINQENKGAPAARNNGFKVAKGEFVIFVDADTICYPYMFKEMIAKLNRYPEVSYCYSQFLFGFKKIKSQEFNADDVKKNNYIDTTTLIRARDFPGFDENLKRFQDWDLWLTMFEKGKAGIFVPMVLYKKIVRGRAGISNWLPSFIYKLPWKSKKVKDYEAAKEIVLKKHHLI
jgi:glycosyltransferase involved in cell wall biosynthesis